MSEAQQTEPAPWWTHLASWGTALRVFGRALPWSLLLLGTVGTVLDRLGALLAFLAPCLALGPAALVELALERQPPARAGRVALAIGLSGAAGTVLAALELSYLRTVWSGGGVAAAAGELAKLAHRPGVIALVSGFVGAVLAVRSLIGPLVMGTDRDDFARERPLTGLAVVILAALVVGPPLGSAVGAGGAILLLALFQTLVHRGIDAAARFLFPAG
ncbi:MAG: hypothetical protein AB7N76_35900 [Planctomycetota bacterium]